jgi:UDP-N-acetyl-D-glucosamine dehydrogenase
MEKFNQIALGLSRKIANRNAKVAVIGLGYVGLPLACELARNRFKVFGIDRDEFRVREVNRGNSYLSDLPDAAIKSLIKGKRLSAVDSFEALSRSDVIIVCVPTPLNKVQDPDLSCVMDAVREIKGRLRKGQLVILESTTYPGTTEEVILPELEQAGLKAGRDFFICFSPERIDPGNLRFRTNNIPKVVGGITETCTKLGVQFYGSLVGKVIPVSSTRTAEMAKLLENTFRIVNIGLINELATVAEALKVDIWEAIEAASTKPFGFMPFYPGPGVGGHCIGIDPVYLSWKAKKHGKNIQFIELARTINLRMPEYIVERVLHLLSTRLHRSIHGSKVLILGVAYKANVSDVRESPAFEIMERLQEYGARVSYHDPYARELKNERSVWRSKRLDQKLIKGQDLVVLLTNHDAFDRAMIAKTARCIFDTRNALKDFRNPNIVKL